MAEGRSARAAPAKARKKDDAESIEKDVRYARLLLMAPDLLGSTESSFDPGQFFFLSFILLSSYPVCLIFVYVTMSCSEIVL